MLKSSDNPPIALPETALGEVHNDRWWVGHTRSRNEKIFAWDLHERAIPYFLPMVERTSFSGGRKRRVLVPLFAGYVFFRGSSESRHQALLTGRLCQVIAEGDQARLLKELRSIQRVLRESGALAPYPVAAVGRRCRIRSGPFAGIEGVVVQRNEYKARIVLQVSILGQGAALEVEGDCLEGVEGPGLTVGIHVAS